MRTKLHIYKVVAEQLSFTKASELLHISQPAVSKTIKNLEESYKSNFFVRRRNSIELTEDGKAFLRYAHQILGIYEEMEDRFVHSRSQMPQALHFGASTTVATYIIPQILAALQIKHPEVQISLRSGNSEEIEKLILQGVLNYGITEGKNTNKQLHYKKFIKDEIVLVTNAHNTTYKDKSITRKQLLELPMVGRELGSGTREVINNYLGDQSLKIVLHLNSTEAIKNYLYHSDYYAFLSINSIREDLMDHKLQIIDLKDLVMERWFYFVSRTGYHSGNMAYFERLMRSSYNF